MNGTVIGQTMLIPEGKAIQRNRAGLKDPNKPVGSFIFGLVGKHSYKVLAKYHLIVKKTN